jgi:glutathione S-transferase
VVELLISTRRYHFFIGIALEGNLKRVFSRRPLCKLNQEQKMGSVDTELYPKASGAAEDLVAAHSEPQPLKLYSGWFCPFVQRAWLVLEEKKIPYQYIEINPYHKAKSFLELNPRGLVPTLGCPVGPDGKDTKPLYESNIICEYLDDSYSDTSKHGHSLLPSDPYARAWCKIWIDYISSRIVPAFYRFCQHQPHSSYSIEDARADFLGHLKIWTNEADPEGPFFRGSNISMVDITLAPWLIRLWVFDHFKTGGLGMPEPGQGGEDEAVWARWRKWASAVEARRSVQETTSAREKYIPAYQRYAEDKTQSQVAQATRAGRSLP